MNCDEFRANLIARAEGLLDEETSRHCETHLETCAACREEQSACDRLHRRLIARGHAASDVSLVAPVMRRIRAVQSEPEGHSIMSKLFTRWGFGLGAVAGAAAIVLIALVLSPKTSATAAEVMARGAQAVAKLNSIHIVGKLRTLPNDNFGHIDVGQPFHDIELWKQFEPELKWRVEKPGRIALMDGQSTLLYIKPPGNMAMKIPQPASSAFDTDWLHRIANLSSAIQNELNNALAQGWPLSLAKERGADGRAKAVVTIETRSGLPENDYVRNKFIDASDTRRVYRFDAQSELLESVQVFVATASGEVQIFELSQIRYNQPIPSEVFTFELPSGVSWYQEPEKLPDNEQYAQLSAEQAARKFFEACGRKDWTEAAKFWPMPWTERLQDGIGGLEIVHLGESFSSQGYPGRFVPYEIKLPGGQVKKHNLALKKDRKTGRWFVDGGF
jgi:outer membrane lipoprotein-sorting protein